MRLRELARGVGVALSAGQADRLLGHLELLECWNRIHNLVGPGSPDEWVERHTVDSLALCPFLEEGEGVDVGSGGGFPGIPIAIAREDLQLTLLEPRQKRGAFLLNARARLGIQNVRILQGKAEELGLGARFDFAISRATFSWSEWIRLAAGLVRRGGRVVATLGLHPPDTDELDEAGAGVGLGLKRVVVYQAGEQPARTLALFERSVPRGTGHPAARNS